MEAPMKPLMQFGLCCLLAPGLFAEHQGGGAVSGGHAGSVKAGSHPGHAHGSMRTLGHSRYYGFGYGGFYGGDYQPFYDSADPGGSNAVIHEYTQWGDNAISPEQASHPILYLIAFRDKSIRAAMTYWVENGALHYLDTGHQQKQAPLSSVDRDLRAQLNSERHVPFNIQ
jgi:hypothetical protein